MHPEELVKLAYRLGVKVDGLDKRTQIITRLMQEARDVELPEEE